MAGGMCGVVLLLVVGCLYRSCPRAQDRLAKVSDPGASRGGSGDGSLFSDVASIDSFWAFRRPDLDSLMNRVMGL